jgi:hypothetical protein
MKAVVVRGYSDLDPNTHHAAGGWPRVGVVPTLGLCLWDRVQEVLVPGGGLAPNNHFWSADFKGDSTQFAEPRTDLHRGRITFSRQVTYALFSCCTESQGVAWKSNADGHHNGHRNHTTLRDLLNAKMS